MAHNVEIAQVVERSGAQYGIIVMSTGHCVIIQGTQVPICDFKKNEDGRVFAGERRGELTDMCSIRDHGHGWKFSAQDKLDILAAYTEWYKNQMAQAI